MADEKIVPVQTPEEIEKTTSELGDDALDQVSGGMGPGVNLAADFVIKGLGNLVNGDIAKKNPIGEIPSVKTVKL